MKKRSKKLLFLLVGVGERPATASKSFLVLFFKKERLSFLLIKTKAPTLLIGVVVAAFLASDASAQSSRPNRAATPGAINPGVTQGNIARTICQAGWTATVRPPEDYTDAIKRRQLRQHERLEDFEEDHLIPLELGGAPWDERNLWPLARKAADGWTAGRKDGLERVLNRLVCDGKLPLVKAQQAIAQDWMGAYHEYVTLPAQALAEARRKLATEPHRKAVPNSCDEYYLSVDRILVHRPTMEACKNARVTAICADGSFSYSLHHQGTCSHHGGVVEWK